MLCANLYFPFGASSGGRALLAGFLQSHVSPESHSLNAIELEYAEGGDLHPSVLLGETGGGRGTGQTSPDLGLLVNEGRGLVLLENKFLEHSFYQCSARRTASSSIRAGNPDPSRCDNALTVASDPKSQCHQSFWGRRYWQHLAPVVDKEALATLAHCPAAHTGYQLSRQQALAEGIAASGKYDFVVSGVAVDARNDGLISSLKRTGISSLEAWAKLFHGQAQFAVFTHQQWVGWVRAQDTAQQWGDWLSYVESRYGYAG